MSAANIILVTCCSDLREDPGKCLDKIYERKSRGCSALIVVVLSWARSWINDDRNTLSLILKFFAISKWFFLVSGQLPTMRILVRVGLSLFILYCCVQPGESCFSSVVLRSRCSLMCLWLMALLASEAMDDGVFWDPSHFGMLCQNALDVLWLCTDATSKSGYV